MGEKIDRAAIVARTLAALRALPQRKVPPVRAIRKVLSEQLRGAGAREVVAIGTTLAKEEPRWMGLRGRHAASRGAGEPDAQGY